MNSKKLSITKPIISITEMAQNLQLSRARFYQLLEAGFFPKPLKDERCKRPYYDIELQKKCLECRHTGIGIDGSYMLFYSPRKNENASISKKSKKVDPRIKEISETLSGMGLETSNKEIKEASQNVFPEGFENENMGIVIREIFKYLKNNL